MTESSRWKGQKNKKKYPGLYEMLKQCAAPSIGDSKREREEEKKIRKRKNDQRKCESMTMNNYYCAI